MRGDVRRSVLLVVAGAATAGFGVFGAVTGAAGTVTYVATVMALALVLLRLDRRVGFSDLVAVGVTGWAVAHLAGGLIGLDGDRVLYNAVLLPHLRYDNVVHFCGFGVAGMAAWEALGSRLESRGRPAGHAQPSVGVVAFHPRQPAPGVRYAESGPSGRTRAVEKDR